MNQSPVKN